ncbi:MAG: LemA family protein [Elusimicrobia bacterium]|nr:LemA family protein [Elusimicrobiota bacterium]
MISTIIVLFVVLALIGYLISMYNRLIFLSNNVKKSWSNIDVILKQRHDEIPKLIATCEGYMQYEKKTLENIVQLRSQAMGARTMNSRIDAEQKLSSALKGFFAIVENYPNLKSNENFLNLQKRISYLEEQIADRRELYNSSATIYNTRIQQIPYNFIAGFGNFTPQELFRATAEERKDVKIQFNMP